MSKSFRILVVSRKQNISKMPVVYKSLDFLGYSRYRIGEDSTIWKFASSKGRWRKLKYHKVKGNYSEVCLYQNGVHKYWMIHRLALLAFIGPCPEGMECRHLDGNPENNHISNLCWGTKLENAQDKVRHGRSSKGRSYNNGESHSKAKLTENQVIRIRELHYNKECNQTELAETYNVSDASISSIVTGRTWKLVGGPRSPLSVRRFTESEIEKILDMYNSGKYSYAAIGREMKSSLQGVRELIIRRR